MIDRCAPPAACLALLAALTCIAAPAPQARAQDRAEPEASLPEDEAVIVAPTSSASAHQAALCARLDALLKQGLPTPERSKTAETRNALHCAAPPAVGPVAGSSHSPGPPRPGQ